MPDTAARIDRWTAEARELIRPFRMADGSTAGLEDLVLRFAGIADRFAQEATIEKASRMIESADRELADVAMGLYATICIGEALRETWSGRAPDGSTLWIEIRPMGPEL